MCLYLCVWQCRKQPSSQRNMVKTAQPHSYSVARAQQFVTGSVNVALTYIFYVMAAAGNVNRVTVVYSNL